MFLLLFLNAFSLNIQLKPETGTPPPSSISSAAVYNPIDQKIYTIGGYYSTENLYSSYIYSFDLRQNKWSYISVFSDLKPSYFQSHQAYLRYNKEILVFSSFSEIYIFSLETKGWRTESLKGDQIGPLSGFSITAINYNSTDYLVIFGGLRTSDITNKLYLVEVNTLVSRLMPSKGNNIPYPRLENTINYYNGSLYVFGYSIQFNIYEKGKIFFRYDLLTESWDLVQAQGDIPPRSISHSSCIYNNELYIAFGGLYETLDLYTSLYKFNFYSKNWTLVTSFPGQEVFFGAPVFVSPVLYIFYGRNMQNVKNSVVSIDLSTTPPQLKTVSKNWVSPNKRFHHCSFVVNRKMYIFGGSVPIVGGTSIYYNDLWSYSFDNDYWEVVTAEGDIPSPRENFGCVKISGDVVVVYGGQGEGVIYSDLYYFHVPGNKWYKVNPANSAPTGRYSSCLAYYDNILYIIGGASKVKAYGTIWTYNFINNLYAKLPFSVFTIEDLNYLGLYDSQCWIEYTNSTIFLNIIGGNNYVLVPNDFQITIQIYSNSSFTNQLQPLGSKADLSSIGSETAVIVTEEYIIRLGGCVYTWLNLPSIVIYNRKTKSITSIPTTGVFESYGHSAVHFNKSIFVFGGAGTNQLFTSLAKIHNNFLTVSLQDHINLTCSQGTTGNDCTPCGFGTYYSSGSCKKCPKGRYSKLLSSTDITQCSPCKSGYYSNTPGSSYCLTCPTGYACPIGSSHPMSTLALIKNSSSQPSKYSDQGAFVSDTTSQLWYIVLGLATLILVVSIRVNWLWSRIKVFDIYTSHHEHELGVPIIFKKNSIGGIFSVFYYLVITVMLVSAFLSYYVNNISEIRTLVPMITLNTPIQAEQLFINTTFYVYGGMCIESYQGNCHKLIEFHTSRGFNFKSANFSCFFYEEECIIALKFEQVSLSSQLVSIDILLKEDTSYSSAISLNISSSSSIPLEMSTVSTSASPGTESFLFRGSDPTNFYFKFTPSLFNSQVSKWPAQQTGFHISQSQNTEIGSVADDKILFLQKNLEVSIIISQSDTALITQRSLIQSWFVFLSSLLGSVFGLSGSIVTAMGVSEIIIEKYMKKKEKTKKIARSRTKSNSLKIEFGLFKDKKNRVIPSLTYATMYTK